MAKLDNPRHEAFAQEIAKGATGAAAYRKVYGEQVKSPRTAASALLKDSDISQRVAEMQGKGAAGAVMTLQQEMEYLTRAIMTPLDQIDETSILCQRVKYSETGRELWMVDKLRALELLAKLKGEFAADRVHVTGAIEHTHVLTDERRKELSEKKRLAMAQRGQFVAGQS